MITPLFRPHPRHETNESYTERIKRENRELFMLHYNCLPKPKTTYDARNYKKSNAN